VVLIQRSAVGKRLNKLKTEYSQDEVPIERGFILELRKWQSLCVETEGQWLFPSPVTGRPYHADSIRADYLVPTGLQLGLGRIGFHTFRHTYRAWLDETGAPVGVQQKLMRHAHVSTTMDQYGNASALAKRKANRATPVEKVCQSADLHSIDKGICEAVPLIGQFWTVAASAQLPVTL
jgi:integrase